MSLHEFSVGRGVTALGPFDQLGFVQWPVHHRRFYTYARERSGPRPELRSVERLAEPEHVSVGIAHADLEHPPRPLGRLVQDVSTAASELLVERADVVRPEVDVEEVGRRPAGSSARPAARG